MIPSAGLLPIISDLPVCSSVRSSGPPLPKRGLYSLKSFFFSLFPLTAVTDASYQEHYRNCPEELGLIFEFLETFCLANQINYSQFSRNPVKFRTQIETSCLPHLWRGAVCQCYQLVAKNQVIVIEQTKFKLHLQRGAVCQYYELSSQELGKTQIT